MGSYTEMVFNLIKNIEGDISCNNLSNTLYNVMLKHKDVFFIIENMILKKCISLFIPFNEGRKEIIELIKNKFESKSVRCESSYLFLIDKLAKAKDINIQIGIIWMMIPVICYFLKESLNE